MKYQVVVMINGNIDPKITIHQAHDRWEAEEIMVLLAKALESSDDWVLTDSDFPNLMAYSSTKNPYSIKTITIEKL